jgi:hypothetical protein
MGDRDRLMEDIHIGEDDRVNISFIYDFIHEKVGRQTGTQASFDNDRS